MVPQAHNLGIYFGSGATPTRDEMRVMAWECIAGGANGIIFYSYFDLQRDPEQSFATRWADLKAVGQDIHDTQSVLLADPAPVGSVTQSSGAHVASRMYALDGFIYLLAVNTSRSVAAADFAFDRLRSPVATLLGRPLSGVAPTTVLSLDFLPLEVRLLRLAAPIPTPQMVRDHFGAVLGGANFLSDADANGDGHIDAKDLLQALRGP